MPDPGEDNGTAGSERFCPACGAPLYGWVKVDPPGRDAGRSHVVDRCEECGLGVTRGGPAPGPSEGNGVAPVSLPGLTASADPDATLERARTALRGGQAAEVRVPNRDSLQAGIGGDQWAALELPAQRLHLTPRSLELLLGRHGLSAARMRQPLLGRNQPWMWQTLLNAFTFHPNFAREVARRRLTPRTARGPLRFAIDAVVSVLAAIPIALLALPLELVAVAFGRGGELVVTVTADDPEPAPAPLYDRSGGS